MFAFSKKIIDEAENSAIGLHSSLAALRRLSLHDFTEFLFSMPDVSRPRLSTSLPQMAPDKVQIEWTGIKGAELLRHSLAFMRVLEVNYARQTGKTLNNKAILDFGCGYGRFIRAMLYYTDPDNLFGVDAWQKSLDTCKEAKLPGNLALSDAVPSSLPVGDTKFDLAFAFSIFTHLSERSARASLSAIRKATKADGLLVLTIRPVEFWAYRDRINKTNSAASMIAQHDAGFAFDSQRSEYGDASMPISFFEGNGWTVAGYDTIPESFQIAVILRPC